MSSRTLVTRAAQGFAPDARFARGGANDGAESGSHTAAGPLEEAFARGCAEGEAAAQRDFETRLHEVEMRFTGMGKAFADLASDEGDRLRARLREMVVALCEATIAPLALDEDLLARRVEAAAGMLKRAQDERHIRLNPDDLLMVRALVSPDLLLEPDPSLERGALRIETIDGGIEDGPESWQQAIREAIGQC